MDSNLTLVGVVFAAAISQNLIMVQFLGLCPFFGTSRDLRQSFGMAMATSLVLVVSVAISFVVRTHLLMPFDAIFLAPLVFIMMIAAVVQLCEMLARYANQAFYRSVGIFFPLITTNCAILGVAMLTLYRFDTLVESVLYALGGGLGFALALVLLGAIRMRLNTAPLPSFMKGTPAAFLTVGIGAMGFTAFGGIF